ncbi:MAG: pyridoxamine 5'-phosphate oxidase [Actinomycetota bacterium]|nr:pyridoxamine 5'-phosphate oxidase [Actinomycetota bacterium]
MSAPDYGDLSRIISGLRRPHEDKPLRETEVEGEPLGQFAVWITAALDAGLAFPNAMTLATASLDGHPSARTVLLKGFDERGFVFFSNYESMKGRELASNPHAALVFYWFELERQVRITGQADRLPERDSDEYFAARPEGSRVSTWASRQSEVIGDRSALEQAAAEVKSRYPGGDIPRPPHWGGYRLVPDEVEFWQGRADRLHDRLRYRRSAKDGWIIERLSP